MSARSEDYRWWLLDGDLDLVSNGHVPGDTLAAALLGVNRALEQLGEGRDADKHPYRLIVTRGSAVVAVRPRSVGIC